MLFNVYSMLHERCVYCICFLCLLTGYLLRNKFLLQFFATLLLLATCLPRLNRSSNANNIVPDVWSTVQHCSHMMSLTAWKKTRTHFLTANLHGTCNLFQPFWFELHPGYHNQLPQRAVAGAIRDHNYDNGFSMQNFQAEVYLGMFLFMEQFGYAVVDVQIEDRP